MHFQSSQDQQIYPPPWLEFIACGHTSRNGCDVKFKEVELSITYWFSELSIIWGHFDLKRAMLNSAGKQYHGYY